ncbi:winged helix-turn-helix transcriptional regulator [Chitinophaga rhizophila]|uniref:Helix-turn-helix transcriptional regulator n=1 Tax=Chitinophaga rhizophila TaxID=2866212 RepID=A0ABS7G5D9_9BACT|nr:helix-turn-helix domain-containing protein [Chitinophaga rhizophila]MBW8682868.1 helix-turn-helix transcriptional regulator [Chitinophaga rhizophila]
MSRIKRSSTHQENKQLLEAECPEIYAANQISGQWTIGICSWLGNGRLRFSELKKVMPGITERILTLELKKLEQRGMIIRHVFPDVPVRVEYELTPIGLELIPILKQLEEWGRKHKAAQSSEV